MSFLTGNEDLDFELDEGGPNTMYDAFKAAQEAAAQERALKDIRSLMDTCNWTAKQAMDALKLSVEEQKKYLMLL